MDTYENDGLIFDVTDTRPDASRAVIALHGFPQDRHCWQRLAGALADAGYRTLAPDQRGYSPRARPEGRRAYRIDLLVRDVLALADAAGTECFDLLGHDWGAVVSWYVAAACPERVRSLCALSVPHPLAVRDAMTRSAQPLRSWYMAPFQLPWLPEFIMSRRGGSLLASRLESDGLDQDTAHRYAQRARVPGAMTGPINWYRALPLDARRPVGAVRVRTLYVWGARDKYVTRAAAERCADHVTGPYRFVTLDQQPHWLPTAAADEIAPMLLQHLGDAHAS